MKTAVGQPVRRGGKWRPERETGKGDQGRTWAYARVCLGFSEASSFKISIHLSSVYTFR